MSNESEDEIRARIKKRLDEFCAEMSTPDNGWGYSESLLDMLVNLEKRPTMTSVQLELKNSDRDT